SGLASGIVRASGPLDKLDMRVHLKSPAISVPHASDATPAGTTPGALTTANLVTTRTLGAVLIDARMRAGALNARVCAFPETSAKPASTTTAVAPASEGEAGTPCSTNEHVWANIVGNLDAVHGAFDLAIDGNVEETSLEDLFPALAARTLSVGAQARVSAQIVRKEGKPVDVRAQATLVQASVQPQGSLRADLVGTTDVLYADGRVLLANDAHFVAPGGQIDVTVGGSVGTDEISLDVNGSVALGLAKAFSTQIANASGAATTTLKLRGRYDTGVVIEGSFEPHSGAVITPRALGQSITFQKGKITFAPASDASAGEAGLIRVSADNLRAHLGEGDVQLNGTADVRTKKLADKGFVARWDMAASGNNVDVKLAGNRAEGAFDLTLKGDESDPQLKGRVDITDGLYRKTLELRNFVLQAQPDKPSEALWVTLTPFGLENLDLEIAVSLANFRARANVANFDADMQLRGNLNVKSSIRLPQIDGAIEVEEGTVDFPRARFDIVEMQVEFPATGSGALIPHINMNARAELPPGSAGNDTEIPVDLDLDGDLVHGLNLDLSATDPQHEWTRSDLLGLILFGRTLSSAVAGGVDTSVAVRALMSEAAAPLTAELEQLAQTTLGVTLEIDPGGWRWQLGRRLQLEGPGLTFGTTTSTTTSTTGSTSTTTATTTYTNTTGAGLTTATAADPASAEDAVRLRLLILDHLGFGKNLSLVGGASSSAGSDLRLSLRFIEQ
ncbi:MAG TPA: translocation/assembly module TamB domain-containing protein, partial [Myxococcota bacterium]